MEPISLLTGLLQQFSPTGHEVGAVNFLVEAMQKSGYQAHIDAVGNAVGTIGSGSREILLLGHIDTVPGKITVREENGVLFGRGAVDAKGPLASFVCAAAASAISPEWRITVIGAVGEEGDSRGAHFLCKNYTPPEMVVIGEPSGWQSITLGYKGSFWTQATITQAASHTASGITSACDRAFKFWHNLQSAALEFNTNRTRVFDQLSPSIRRMRSFSDGFEDSALLDINIRLPQFIDLSFLDSLLSACAEKTGSNVKTSTQDFMPAFLAGKNTPLVKAFLASIRAAGGTPGFKLKTGTSDMNLVGPTWNCPMIAYSAGDSNLDHTATEHIILQEYLTGIQVIKDSLERIQGF